MVNKRISFLNTPQCHAYETPKRQAGLSRTTAEPTHRPISWFASSSRCSCSREAPDHFSCALLAPAGIPRPLSSAVGTCKGLRPFPGLRDESVGEMARHVYRTKVVPRAAGSRYVLPPSQVRPCSPPIRKRSPHGAPEDTQRRPFPEHQRGEQLPAYRSGNMRQSSRCHFVAERKCRRTRIRLQKFRSRPYP